MTYLDTTCLWHPNYDRLAGLVYYMSSVCVCVKLQPDSQKKKNNGWEKQNKRLEVKDRRQTKKRGFCLASLCKITPAVKNERMHHTHPGVHTHTHTNEHTACSLHLQEFIHSVTKLGKKSTVCDEAATVMLGATAECDLSLSPQF